VVTSVKPSPLPPDVHPDRESRPGEGGSSRPSLDPEFLALFSRLDQLLEQLKQAGTGRQPSRAVWVLQQVVEQNIAFSDRHFAAALADRRIGPNLKTLSEFLSSIVPLQEQLAPAGLLGFLGLSGSRRGAKKADLSEAAREQFGKFLRQACELVEFYFRVYAEFLSPSRPDRKWLEIAAGYWVSLSRLCKEWECELNG
jgi:hypothetical protein